MTLFARINEEELQVYVQTSEGTVFLVTGVTLVEQVKDFILTKTLIPISAQRLSFGGQVLQDHELLKSYGIVNFDTLEVLDKRVFGKDENGGQIVLD